MSPAARLQRGQLPAKLLGVFEQPRDAYDRAVDRRDAPGDPAVLLVAEKDPLHGHPIVLPQELAEPHDLETDVMIARQRPENLLLAALDAPRDADLALLVEKRHRSHLTQVHPHGVIGLVERARVELEAVQLLPAEFLRLLVLGLFPLQPVLRVDQLDPLLSEQHEDVVDLLR